MSPALFETERLVVRPKTLDDAGAFHELYADGEVMCHSGGPFGSLEQTREFVAAHVRHQERNGFSMWALVERSSGEIVGEVGFLACDEGVEIGWRLRRSAWGRGYATEAASACLSYGFGELGFPRVLAFTESANAASLRVIRKLGMRFVRRGEGGVPAWEEYVALPSTPSGSSAPRGTVPRPPIRRPRPVP